MTDTSKDAVKSLVSRAFMQPENEQYFHDMGDVVDAVLAERDTLREENKALREAHSWTMKHWRGDCFSGVMMSVAEEMDAAYRIATAAKGECA